jgi:hypothetical protein
VSIHIKVDSLYAARHDKIFLYGFDVLEFTVGGHRQVTTKTNEDCHLHWERIFCLSLLVDVSARWLLSCRFVSCHIM